MSATRTVKVPGGNTAPPGKGRKTGFEARLFSSRRLLLLVSAIVLIVILGLYRLSRFVPTPFDSPATLRPKFYALFSHFIQRYPALEQAYQAWGTYCLIALVIPVVLAFWNYFYNRSGSRSFETLHKVIGSRTVFFLSIGACLLVCRFPILLAGDMNPDETFFIAAAEKLFIDPIFFRAVDFVTSGPLNVYPLMLPGAFGFSPDYVSTRLIALLLIFASIYVMYRVLALLADDDVARIAILPAAGVFAVLKYHDFVDYTSEHTSFLLLSLAFYLCVKTFLQPERYPWRIWGLGLLTATAFLAKMQAVPVLLCVTAVAGVYVYRAGRARQWWRPAFLFGLGLAPLLLLHALICVWAGVWHDFWMEYIIGNFYNVQSYGTLTSEMQRFANFAVGVTDIRTLITGLLAVMAAYLFHKNRRERASDESLFLETTAVGAFVAVAASWILSTAGGAVISYAVLISILILPGAFVLLYRKPDRRPDPIRWFGFLVAAVLAAAVAVAYAPHRLFGHYLLLLLLPASMAMSWPVLSASARGDAVARLGGAGLKGGLPVPFLLAFGVLTLGWQIFQLGSKNFESFAQIPFTVRAPQSDLVESLTPPGGKITVWGWDGRPYVGSGRVSGLKDLIAGQLFFENNPAVQTYYREAYLRGIRQHPPELFIDAVDDPQGPFDRKNRFETIPEINSFIQSNYVYVLSAFDERYYIRRDLARTVAGIGEPRKCDVQAIRCFEAGAGIHSPASLPAVQIPQYASLEAVFTPETKQDTDATVFSNQSGPAAHDGFQFQHLANDHYRLAIGQGTDWAFSKELWLPQRKPVLLTIEFNDKLVTVIANGIKCDEMRLPQRMPDSPGNITLGSWADHKHPFLGNIQFFQIRNLGSGR